MIKKILKFQTKLKEFKIQKNLQIEKNFSFELLKSGYMSSNRTIFLNVKQLRAGEALVYNKKSNRLITKKYFNYLRFKNTKQK